jgi:hypothetical protein
MLFDIYSLIFNFLLKYIYIFFFYILEILTNHSNGWLSPYYGILSKIEVKFFNTYSDRNDFNLNSLINTEYVLTWSMFGMVFELIILALVTIIPLLISIAYYTLAERKVMASIQRRKGPNVVGFWGLLQPLADGLKLVIKEMIIPRRSNIILFIFAPMLTLVLSFLM